ncbi:MAG: hypothetical protein ACT4R6_00390 [Gemmatimonadaceae bacterium]
MKPHRLTKDMLGPSAAGFVLTRDVRDAHGVVLLAKGSRLTSATMPRLQALDWDALHAVELEPDELDECEGGSRLARAAAGRDVTVKGMSAGHWPLEAACRGLLRVETPALRTLNLQEATAVYTLFHGQVVDAGETVARVKIVPFAVPRETIERAEREAASNGGIVHIRRFERQKVAIIIEESLGDSAVRRVHAALREKVAWLGSELLEPLVAEQDAAAVARAVAAVQAREARVIVVAGSRLMDPLEPALAAVARLGGTIERRGTPAHPGSLLWFARLTSAAGECTVLGLPSCGLFSQATVFDLLMPRILAGERLTSELVAELGHGGLLTRDMAFRFPPYRERAAARRGEVLEE